MPKSTQRWRTNLSNSSNVPSSSSGGCARERLTCRPCARARGARDRPPLPLPLPSGAALLCDRWLWLLRKILAKGSDRAWFQTPDPPADEDLDRASEDPKDGDSFVPKMRTARWVASQVVPSSSTTPRSSSAPIAPARCKGDLKE